MPLLRPPPLRDALPVRSADLSGLGSRERNLPEVKAWQRPSEWARASQYWLQLGHPDLALKELETLPETARRHAWPLRVHLAALHATNAISA